MAHNIYEVLWMKVILDDLKIKYEDPKRLFCDNPAISILFFIPPCHQISSHKHVVL